MLELVRATRCLKLMVSAKLDNVSHSSKNFQQTTYFIKFNLRYDWIYFQPYNKLTYLDIFCLRLYCIGFCQIRAFFAQKSLESYQISRWNVCLSSKWLEANWFPMLFILHFFLTPSIFGNVSEFFSYSKTFQHIGALYRLILCFDMGGWFILY